MRTIPSYIANAGIVGAPMDFKWKGTLAHMGPIDGTALHATIYKINHCGVTTLAAALEEWAAVRFQGLIDRDRYVSHAHSLLAWEVDRRYYKGESSLDTIESPQANSLMEELSHYACRMTAKQFVDYPSTVPMAAVHEAFLLRFVIPKAKRKVFEAWFKFASDRLIEVSPMPPGSYQDYPTFDAYHADKAKYRGLPVPLEALDPEFDYKPEMRAELIDRHLQSLDWASSPFLRSPDEMKALGFEGTPYRYG